MAQRVRSTRNKKIVNHIPSFSGLILREGRAESLLREKDENAMNT